MNLPASHLFRLAIIFSSGYSRAHNIGGVMIDQLAFNLSEFAITVSDFASL